VITSDLAEFIQSGVAIHVATRSPRLVPDEARGIGVRVEAGGVEVTIFIAAATARQALENLADNGRIAAVFSRPIDHRTYQLKGGATSVRVADDADRAVIERYRRALVDAYTVVGVPPSITWRIAVWPAHAIRFRVENVFVQTPGPGAGAPLVAGSAA
jgi:hypothetical protein